MTKFTFIWLTFPYVRVPLRNTSCNMLSLGHARQYAKTDDGTSDPTCALALFCFSTYRYHLDLSFIPQKPSPVLP